MNTIHQTEISLLNMFWKRHLRVLKNKPIDGVSPLYFKSKGSPLENYRIFGNTVNGSSVGDLVTVGSHAGEYSIPITLNNVTTQIYLPVPLRKVGSETDYIDFSQQKLFRIRKNLLNITARSQTLNGLTFTVNADNSITINGTSTSGTSFVFGRNLTYSHNFIYSSGNAGLDSDIKVDLYSTNISGNYYNAVPRVNVDSNSEIIWIFRIYVKENITVDNVTVYPMVCRTDVTDMGYEPFYEQTVLSVELPELQTAVGNNVLSVDTTIPPDRIILKGGIVQQNLSI